MTTTNRDRIEFLRTRVQELQRLIIDAQREPECLAYMAELERGREPVMLDDAEWSVLLPAERDAKLIPYFICVRTELQEMTKRAEAPSTLQRVNAWLDAPWIRVILATATILEVARLLLHLAGANVHFLSEPSDDSADLVLRHKHPPEAEQS